MNFPESIQNLINSFKLLPGIGEKTAERMAFSILQLDEDAIQNFSKNIKDVKTKIRRCDKCNNISEKEICEICASKTRNTKILCVVEEPKNVFLFEKVGSFNGLYYVLDGLISPIDGIGPKEIGIPNLLSKIEKEQPEEIILALKPSVEGETTALYIKKLLEEQEIVVSKIAHGIPLGADIEFIDTLTLEMALEDRKKL